MKLGEKLMQEHAMLDFHKIVLDTDSRERLLKREVTGYNKIQPINFLWKLLIFLRVSHII